MRNLIYCLLLTFLLASCSAGGTSPMEAKAMKNPVEATPKSIASGKIVYDKYCAECHGATGNGVSEKATTLAQAGAAKPSDLTDDKWEQGGTEGVHCV